jgi:hypothetical protein
MRAEAVVDAVAEREVPVRVPAEVEDSGMIEYRGIAVDYPECDDCCLPFWHDGVAEPDSRRGSPRHPECDRGTPESAASPPHTVSRWNEETIIPGPVTMTSSADLGHQLPHWEARSCCHRAAIQQEGPTAASGDQAPDLQELGSGGDLNPRPLGYEPSGHCSGRGASITPIFGVLLLGTPCSTSTAPRPAGAVIG